MTISQFWVAWSPRDRETSKINFYYDFLGLFEILYLPCNEFYFGINNHNSINIIESEMWLHHILLKVWRIKKWRKPFYPIKHFHKNISYLYGSTGLRSLWITSSGNNKKSKRILKVLDFDSTNINHVENP